MEVKVAVDAMGGDYAPAEAVRGAVDAAVEFSQISVILVGREDAIKKELSGVKKE
ncbi:MAG: phosphate acyltransferase, partial [Eubacterium sp.]|nr:phosphate acyltransferase [Eubacterium sp.]